MDNYLNFLGNSQTFLGVISTIIILFMFKNSDSNFLFIILSDIKLYVVDKISKIKPEISFESLKQDPSYKSVLLYSQWNKEDKKNELLKRNCAELCMKVDSEQMQFQARLTNWDDNVNRFATIISEKEELQMSPMFIFAYTIVVFVVDELLRCSFIPGTAFILSGFYLLTIYVFLFWTAKWIYFFVKDENAVCTSKTRKGKSIPPKNLFQQFMFLISGSISRFLIFMFVLLFDVWAIAELDCLQVNIKFWLLFGSIILLSIVYGLNSTTSHYGQHAGAIYTRHVFYFSSMVITSICCGFIMTTCYPNIIEYAHLQNNYVIFWAKLVSIFIILCFGLVFPFVLPLSRYLFMYVKAEFMNVWYKVLIFYTTKKLKSSFKELSKMIPV